MADYVDPRAAFVNELQRRGEPVPEGYVKVDDPVQKLMQELRNREQSPAPGEQITPEQDQALRQPQVPTGDGLEQAPSLSAPAQTESTPPAPVAPVQDFKRNMGMAISAPTDLVDMAAGGTNFLINEATAAWSDLAKRIGLDIPATDLSTSPFHDAGRNVDLLPEGGPKTLWDQVFYELGGSTTALIGATPALIKLSQRAAQRSALTAGETRYVETAPGKRPTALGTTPLEHMGTAILERPITTALIESSGAVGSALGAYRSREAGDSPGMQALSAIVGGGLVSGLTQGTIGGFRLASEALYNVIGPFVPVTGGRPTIARTAAVERLRDVTENPLTALANLEEPTSTTMSAAQRSGDQGLLSLDATARAKNAKLEGQHRARMEQAHDDLVGQMRDIAPGPGDFANVQEKLQAMNEALRVRLQYRLTQAKEGADQAIEKMSPNRTVKELDDVVRKEMTDAMLDSKRQEVQLWDVAKQSADVRVPPNRLHEAILGAITDPFRQGNRVTEVVPKYILREIKALGDKPTVGQLESLRRSLGERAAGAFNMGKKEQGVVLRELQDAILTDLGEVPGEAIQNAVNYSRLHNETFFNGPIGRLLGHGNAETRPAQQVAQAGNLHGAMQMDRIIKDIDKLGASGHYAFGEMLRAGFIRTAAPDGTINPKRAQAWLTNNAEILDRFPQVRNNIVDAVDKQDRVRLAQEAVGNYEKPQNISGKAIAKVLQVEHPQDAYNTIMRSKTPRADIQGINRKLAGDDLAKQGFKSEFVKWAMSKATDGDGVLHGKQLRTFLESPKVQMMSKALLGNRARYHLKKLATDLEVIQAQAPGKEGMLVDANNFYGTVLQIGGAVLGRKVSHIAGGGTIQVPAIVSRLARSTGMGLTAGPARQLLADALTSEDTTLLKSLLEDVTRGRGMQTASKQIRSWAVQDTLSNFSDMLSEQLGPDEQGDVGGGR